jgi:hypothetical protein
MLWPCECQVQMQRGGVAVKATSNLRGLIDIYTNEFTAVCQALSSTSLI